MSKKPGTIQWEKPLDKEAKNPVSDFMQYCLDIYPRKDKSLLDKEITNFSKSATTLSNQIDTFRKNIAEVPLLSVIVLWVRNLANDTFHALRNAETMHQLMKQGFIGLKDTRGNVWTLKDMVSMGHESIIEAIRCNECWSQEKTEEYIQFYIGFVNWLSEATSGYVPKAVDPDIQKTIQRKIPHSEFLTIAKHLKDRERVMAELLYYGGDRLLDEVQNLKIQDIRENQVFFRNGSVQYPKHVFKNLLSFIGNRKKGYLFVGRNGEKIDQSVPYRALKVVVSKLNLDPSFTFLEFLRSI